MEEFVSGYCKALDSARTVLVEDGEADCAWPDCPYAPACPVAGKIGEFFAKYPEEALKG